MAFSLNQYDFIESVKKKLVIFPTLTVVLRDPILRFKEKSMVTSFKGIEVLPPQFFCLPLLQEYNRHEENAQHHVAKVGVDVVEI